MEASALEAYEVYKKHGFSSEEAEIVVASKDEKLSKWVVSKEGLALVKGELKEEMAYAFFYSLSIPKKSVNSFNIRRGYLWS